MKIQRQLFNEDSGLKIFASLIAGLAIAFSLCNHFTQFWTRGALTQVLFWIVGSIICSICFLVIYFYSVSYHRLTYSIGIKIAWFLFLMVMTGMIWLLNPEMTPVPRRQHTLSIVATGEKNAESQGTSVQIIRTKLDEETLPASAYLQRGIWEVYPSVIVSNDIQPASLNYSFRFGVEREIQVLLVSGPAQGIVDVRLDDEAERIDLYDPIPERKKTVHFAIVNEKDPFWQPVLVGVDIITFTMVLFLLIPPFFSKIQKLPHYRMDTSITSLEKRFSTKANRLVRIFCRWMKNTFVMVIVNIILIGGVLYILEGILWIVDPASKLPFNGLKDGVTYTWGHMVKNNLDGFREREFISPKPAGVCRIMALGDSLTWGQGLAVEERYTNVLESMLNASFPEKEIQVLNFGIQGLSTAAERDILQNYRGYIQPDYITIGFCYNDPQPKSQDYRVEKVIFEQNHPWITNKIPEYMRRIGLKRISDRYRTALETALIKAGVIPDWPTGLDRTYDHNSLQWKEFEVALQDIKSMADEMQLPPPLFATLNEGTFTDRPPNFTHPDYYMQYILRWTTQARDAAVQNGFETVDFQSELSTTFQTEPMAVNILDGHPNAKANQIYAQKLYAIIATKITSGEICR